MIATLLITKAMRTIFQLSYVFLLAAFVAGCSKPELNNSITSANESLNAAATPDKPNIILILADDLGYEIPHYTGGQSYPTPNLNNLAVRGTQFTRCYSAPLCSPSRVMLLTGKYNFRNYTTWGKLDTTQRTIANLLKKAGYATCVTGKWQFDGGDASIRKFGFQKYLVTNPFFLDEAGEESLSIYKNPQVYENGAYWRASATQGKYAEDLFRNYMFNFIDENKSKHPFFIYWSLNLVHKPFCPTPDDPEFAAWNPLRKKQPGDSIYYPSMVKYMDKLVGQLMTKLKNDKLQSNTLVLFLGDNGSVADIHSLYNGQIVTGDKASSTGAGTHVPMLAFMQGRVLPGAIDSNLISIVDFMSTASDIAQVAIPQTYGTIDGISFAPQLQGDYTTVRPWIFCHYTGSGKVETNPNFLRRWMHNKTYKQYDTLPNANISKRFFNIKLDPKERSPISPDKMTAKEKQISQQFLKNMKSLH